MSITRTGLTITDASAPQPEPQPQGRAKGSWYTRCPLCGCTAAHRCQRRPAGSAQPEHCTPSGTNPRCSHCQECDLCHGPLDAEAQLLSVSAHKVRLCAACALKPSGSVAVDRLVEAYLFTTNPTYLRHLTETAFAPSTLRAIDSDN